MKIVCNVFINNRMLSSLSIAKPKKPVKSTLALCKHPKTKDFCMIIFTNENKTGTKYIIRENIRRVLTKYINEGKCTIQFREPEHDLLINGDSDQLKKFLQLFKRVLENNVTMAEMDSLSSLAVTPVKAKDMPIKKLTILTRSSYPSGGFPKTLEELIIYGINLKTLDAGILQLVKLNVLELCHNDIEFIPEALNALPNLKELDLSHNSLYRSKPSQWDWLGGNLKSTLKFLNLSHNQLRTLPNHISNLFELNSLFLNSNCLIELPPSIGNLQNLRGLFASENKLSMLPGSIAKLKLLTIDVSSNDFYKNPLPVLEKSKKPLPICSLKEYAARKVLDTRVPHPPGSLPKTVIQYLDNAKYCFCGRACFEVFARTLHSLRMTNVAGTVNTAAGERVYAPMDVYFCSSYCSTDFCPPTNNRPNDSYMYNFNPQGSFYGRQY